MSHGARRTWLGACLLLAGGVAPAQQQDFSKVEVTTEKVAAGVIQGRKVADGVRKAGARPVASILLLNRLSRS